MPCLSHSPAAGRNERLPELAAQVLKADPQVIVVLTAPATRVLQQATATIPIVMWAVGDPVEYGLVASLAIAKREPWVSLRNDWTFTPSECNAYPSFEQAL